jgi:beta-glucosidase
MGTRPGILIAIALSSLTFAAEPPKVEARKAQLISKDGLQFRDLNKNGTLDRYEDWRLPVDQRIADLVSKMTPEEKSGLT